MLRNTAVSLLDTPNFTLGMDAPLSDISNHRAEEVGLCKWLLSIRNKGAESEQTVGAPCYQWVGCRDHAGIACFPHSGSWQAQGGPAYVCTDQRKKCFLHNMGPLRLTSSPFRTYISDRHVNLNLKAHSKYTLAYKQPIKSLDYVACYKWHDQPII